MDAFDKIIGYSEEKKELARIADALKNREAYERLGVSAPRGLLLVGDPGLGKTLMATSLIEASERRAFICRKDQPNGEFIRTIKATFEEAAANAPSIVLLDDMDKFANGDENRRDAEEYVTVQSCIDEIKGQDVFVLATVNNIRTMPKSLQRAGRFDRVMKIRPPHGSDAVKIITHYLQGKCFVGDMDAELIARIMSGRSCAELETVINEAGMYAGFERSSEINMEHFMAACMKSIFDVSGHLGRDNDDYDDDDDDDGDCGSSDGCGDVSYVAYHEAGHAVVSEVLCPGSVTLISVRGNGNGIGGFTNYADPGNVSPMLSLERHILASLGGMAAIELKYGISDPGCRDDLSDAFDAVRRKVVDLCMNGFRFYSYGYNDSSELKASQEQIVATEVERYFRKAKDILYENREFLEKTASALAQKGLLTMLDVRAIKCECACLKEAG